MINYNNPYANIHTLTIHRCPYCGGTRYTNTGLVTVNGVEFACDNCGQTIHVSPESTMYDYVNFIQNHWPNPDTIYDPHMYGIPM